MFFNTTKALKNQFAMWYILAYDVFLHIWIWLNKGNLHTKNKQPTQIFINSSLVTVDPEPIHIMLSVKQEHTDGTPVHYQSPYTQALTNT